MDTNGKYLVQINSSVIVCSQDSDCPFDAYCGLNLTWAALPAMCVCPYYYGGAGPDCRTMIPIWGSLLYSISAIVAVIAFFVSLFSCRDIWLVWNELRKSPYSAFSSTLIFNTIAAFSLLGYQISIMCRARTAYLVFTAVSFFSLSFSGLDISLVWLEVGFVVEKMSTRVYKNVYRYRIFLLLYYLTFVVVVITFAGLGRLDISAYAAVPGVLYISITYFLAFIRVRRLYQQRSSVEQTPPDSPAERNHIRVTHTLRRISNTALIMSLLMINAVVSEAIGIALGGPTDGNTPERTPAELCTRFFWVFVGLVNLTISLYLHELVKAKTNTRTSPLKVSSRKKYGPPVPAEPTVEDSS